MSRRDPKCVDEELLEGTKKKRSWVKMAFPPVAPGGASSPWLLWRHCTCRDDKLQLHLE